MKKNRKMIIVVILVLVFINVLSLFNTSAVIRDSANGVSYQINDIKRVRKLNNALKDVYESGVKTESSNIRYSNEYSVVINYLNTRSSYSIHSGKLVYRKNIAFTQIVNQTVIVDSKKLDSISNLIYLESNRFEYDK